MRLLYKCSIPPKRPQMGIHNFGFGFIFYYLFSYFSVPFFVETYTYFFNAKFKEEIFEYFFAFDNIYTYEALWLAFLGLMSFCLGYFILGRISFKPPSIYRANWSSFKLYYGGIGLFVGGYLIKFYGMATGSVRTLQYEDAIIQNTLFSYVIAPNPLHLFGLLLLIIYYLKDKDKRKKRNVKMVGGVLLFIYLISIVNLGSKYMMLAPFIFAVIIKSMTGTLYLKKAIVALALVTITIFTLDQYKNSFAQDWQVQSTLFSRIDPFVTRLSQIQTFTQIVDVDAEKWNGRSFLQFFEEFKPKGFRQNYIPQTWAKEYRLIADSDDKTGVASTNIGDFYLNFGSLGLLLGMLVMGFLHRMLYNFLVSTEMFCYAAIPSLWIVIIHGSESFISILYVSIIKTFLLMTVIHLLLVDFKVKLPHRKVVL